MLPTFVFARSKVTESAASALPWTTLAWVKATAFNCLIASFTRSNFFALLTAQRWEKISTMEGTLSNDAVLEQHIPWESYKMNGQISDRDFTLIKKYDKSPETVKAAELDEVCVVTLHVPYRRSMADVKAL